MKLMTHYELNIESTYKEYKQGKEEIRREKLR